MVIRFLLQLRDSHAAYLFPNRNDFQKRRYYLDLQF